MQDLDKRIYEIGVNMVNCRENCQGICNNPQEGIIPRCLVLHSPEAKGLGCAIVGINPGQHGDQEVKYYLDNGIHYNSVTSFWDLNLNQHKYYIFLSDFIKCLNISGPILWTELVKCQNAKGIGFPPMQTFRNCTSKFLVKEIKALPDEWPLIAVGRESHKALCYLFPKRTVIGVPHPTASRGHFSRLFANSSRKQFTNKQKTAIENMKMNGSTEIWLEATKKK